MKMIFTGKVSGEKTVLTAGARHTVKAQAGEQYGLVDEVTGLVPDGVEADRSGDDLILRKKEDDTEIRIEGFWEECQPGETQCTAVFNVVGENGQVTEAVLTQDGPVLENFTAGQSGTLVEGINNGIIWGGIAFGAGLAAIALAAGGGGGSSRHKRATEDEQKPVQPEGGQEAGKTDVSSTGSIEPESGNLSGRVTDQDGNGKADAEEAAAAVAAATEKVEAAEAADKAAKDKLAELNADKLITPEEKAQLETAKQNADTLKGEADSAVKALPDTAAEKGGLQGRVDALDGIQVPEVNDQDGNGKADAEEAAVAFYERALPSNVSGDLYPQPSIFGDKVSSVSKNWSTLLDSNPGSYVTSQRLDSGANQYNYNGHTGSDVISITDSFGGLDRTQVSRFPVGLFTGEGNDLIVTGRDYGRNTSAGYTDHSHRTDMGNGDDTLVVGVGNNDVTLYVNEEGQLRATTDSYNGSTSIDYTGLNSSSSGGTISGTDIVMGAGNDTVLALGYEGNSADAIINTNIDLGAGNDFIYANGEISTNNGTQVNIIGGEGFDTISLDNTTVTSAMFSGFEHVDLHSTSHLILNSDDFKSQDIEGEILKISGSSGASVDVQNFDWENLSSANDGDVKYFTYQSTGNDSNLLI
ncbi:GA-like domain-containing protein, partial [Escherichia coli]|uniref:GA-like domain-containing protein n=1 Tax=Escherichia coli TaxID=562 RepID=UPI00079FEA56